MGARKTIFIISNDNIPASNGFMNFLNPSSNIMKQPRKIPADDIQIASHITNAPSGMTRGMIENSSKMLPKVRQNPNVLLNDNRACSNTELLIRPFFPISFHYKYLLHN